MDINAKIGILGGGQLGRMMVEASIPLCLDISVLDENLDYPAAGICTRFYEGSFSDYEDVLEFGMDMDIITVEIESVNTEALQVLESRGKKVYPQAAVLNIINDKGTQKQFYHDNRIPTSSFILVNSKEDVQELLNKNEISYPFVHKLRKGGYDGRGVAIINSEVDLDLAFDAPSVIEQKVRVKKEIAVIAARSAKGEVALFPAVEMVFHPVANLVEYLFCPANIDEETQTQIDDIARSLVDTLKLVGLLAIEFFLDEEGRVMVNEIAPRPHNSGHHTIEANVTSQFEQHLRAILGLPLGSTALTIPAAMVNLLGEEGYHGPAFYQGIEDLLAVPGIHPHLYHKKITKPKRKMGHITVTHPQAEQLPNLINTVKNTIKVISKF